MRDRSKDNPVGEVTRIKRPAGDEETRGQANVGSRMIPDPAKAPPPPPPPLSGGTSFADK